MSSGANGSSTKNGWYFSSCLQRLIASIGGMRSWMSWSRSISSPHVLRTCSNISTAPLMYGRTSISESRDKPNPASLKSAFRDSCCEP